MSANAPDPPPLDVWRPVYLRLIAFPVELAFAASQNWWTELTGKEFESAEEKRGRCEREVTGEYGGVRLALSVNPLKIIWTAEPIVQENPEEAVTTLGRFADRCIWFRDLMSKWLTSVKPELHRLAFAGLLVYPVEGGRRETYQMLDRHLRLIDMPLDGSDFVYRVNKPKVSRLGPEAPKINVLRSWLAVRAGHTAMPVPQGSEVVLSEAYCCGVDLDINTVAEFSGPFPNSRLDELFSEFTDLALEVVTNGEVP